MGEYALPSSFAGYPIYLVGIKGTGMSALAELLVERGANVHGSDIADTFYTDEILKKLNIPFNETFDPANIAGNTELVVYSAAYDKDTHPELTAAVARGIPVVTYAEALGLLSNQIDASGIAGAHGKTTTTAMAGTIMKSIGLPVSVIVGSAVSSFGDRSTFFGGQEFFVAETCEYRKHFLSFHPDCIVVTNVELDHTDYFKNERQMFRAFEEYAMLLPDDGKLIYCADDRGADAIAEYIRREKSGVSTTGYGFRADGGYRIAGVTELPGQNRFRLSGTDSEYVLNVPGIHNVQNATAAVALTEHLVRKWKGQCTVEDSRAIARGLDSFKGSRRRNEIVGMNGRALILDDYAHHPTAITSALKGLRKFYPGRRLIVDFMSHTYSRTETLFERFVRAFDDADILILHKIYSSAREKRGNISGRDLYEAIRKRRPGIYYYEEVMDAYDFCVNTIEDNDVFVTLGAGDNWKLGRALVRAA